MKATISLFMLVLLCSVPACAQDMNGNHHHNNNAPAAADTDLMESQVTAVALFLFSG